MTASNVDAGDSNTSAGLSAWLSEATALAAIPMAGYLVAFVYQLGFCAQFRITPAFIALELGTVLSATLPLGVWALVMGAAFSGAAFWGRPPIRTVAVLAVSLPFVVWGYNGAWLSVLMTAFLEGGEYVVRRYWPTAAAPPLTYSSRLTWKLHWAAYLVMVAASFIFVSYLGGKREANTQVEFLVRRGTPDLAVLRVYGGHLIAAPL